MARQLAILASLVMLAHPVMAADQTDDTLQRIAKTGKMTIGYVPDAPPMSLSDEDGNVVGYSIDLCRRIASVVQKELGLAKLDLAYVPLIAPEERIRAVEEGTVDIECGATTVTLSRRERVDFTLMTFITGGAVLSLERAPIPSMASLSGKTIVVIEGTTTETALKNFTEVNDFLVEIKHIATHEEGIRLLNEGKADGYASDRAMLVGQALRSAGGKFTITRDVFSFEPYALMLKRGDTDFRLLADRALADLFGGARILRLYHEWFGQYGEPLPPIVKAVYEFQAVGE